MKSPMVIEMRIENSRMREIQKIKLSKTMDSLPDQAGFKLELNTIININTESHQKKWPMVIEMKTESLKMREMAKTM